MLTVYIVAAIIGGGLILMSALFDSGDHGGGDHDFNADHDASLHVDHDTPGGFGDIAQWIPFFSLRFWTYALAMFGAVGWASTAFTNTAQATVLVGSIISGFVLGTIVATTMRIMTRASSDSSVRTEDLLGAQGKVTVPVHASTDGKIRLMLKGDSIDFLALSNDDRSLQPGEEVVVVAVENDRLRVIPKTDLLQELP